jgi:photosystem II stability/assembly factor-like uncharacterized protein
VGVLILAGTRKGLFLLRGDDDRRDWKVEGPVLTGWEVFHATRDARDGTLLACTNNWVYGANVHRSTDRGATWERSEGLGLPDDSELTLEKTWHVEPGHPSQPDTLWLGGAPGVLFRSDDRGESWQVVRGLVEHPTRERWNPGAGGMCCHSISLDPTDPQRLFVAISAAGGFRTEDGAETWTPVNKNVAADFFPDDPYPEVGQCVHKLLVHPERPDRLWQQNHCGVYRSDDRGDEWVRLDDNGLPSSFGFALAIHPRDPDTAWVVPEEGAENRVTCNGELGVYRTRDAGESWEVRPAQDAAWAAILRENGASDWLDPVGVYVGTQSGSLFVSPDEGETWIEAARHLPPVLSVEVAEWQ